MTGMHKHDDRDVALAFVGSLVPDTAEFHNPAFSRAGNMFQLNLLAGLARAGLTCSAILSAQPTPSFPRSSLLWSGLRRVRVPEGLEVTLLPFLNVSPLKQVFVSIFALFFLVRWALSNRSRARVIQCYNLTVPNGWFIWLAGRLTRSQVHVCLADINVPGETVPKSLSHQVDYELQRRLIPRLDGHVVIASKIMEHFAPGRRYLKLLGGVSSQVVGRTRSARNRPAEFTVVFAGALTDVNGVDLLLSALTRLPDMQLRLRIAGVGPCLSLVEQATKRDPRIEYCGYCSHDEVLRLYSTADLLLNIRLTKTVDTSYLFPSKLLEYLATGVPVLTTVMGDVADEFGDFVYLLEEETAEGLARGISEIAQAPATERDALGERAVAYVKDQLTWDSQAVKVRSYILECLNNRVAA